jgi:hypothetical protein
MRNSFLILTAAAALAAEPAARVSPPILGYVYDSASKSVRPIAGIPGAAAIEGALPSATKLEAGFVSQNRRYVLAGTLEGAVLIDVAANTSTSIEGAPSDIALGAWSSDSRSVALWTRSGHVQVWTGFPDSPAMRFSAEAETPAGLAVADDGAAALVWNDSGLSFIDVDGSRQIVSGRVGGAAFKAGSSEWAAVTDSQLLRSNMEPAPIGIAKASAVAFATRSVLVAGEKAIAVIDESGSRLVECDCIATSLEKLAGTDVFRLTGLEAPSLAIYDGDSAEPRIVYVPTEGGRR